MDEAVEEEVYPADESKSAKLDRIVNYYLDENETLNLRRLGAKRVGSPSSI
jgi:hypothetical protein